MKKWTFKPVDRSTIDLFPACIDNYLPDDHMAHFVVNVVDQLDLSKLIKSYRGSGTQAWHPAMMLALLFYGKDQVNLTDKESRIMPASGGAFEQAYNAQASVDVESGLIITRHVTQAPNDKKEVEPTLNQLQALEPFLGKATGLLSDTEYFSEANVFAVDNLALTPYIAIKR